jgi:hypothetical protein
MDQWTSAMLRQGMTFLKAPTLQFHYSIPVRGSFITYISFSKLYNLFFLVNFRDYVRLSQSFGFETFAV